METAKAKTPVLLMILDGFGEAPPSPFNAVTLAKPKFYEGMRKEGFFTTIETSGKRVGLPDGQMGNSEVGHLTIGAGRVLYQDLLRIDNAIKEGSFARNEALLGMITKVRESGGKIHLLGLVSNGGVHSSDGHLSAILKVVDQEGIGERTFLHAFLDGRDTPPKSARGFLERFSKECKAIGGKVATISGRFYAMDRDKRWDRVKKAWDALVLGKGQKAENCLEALDLAYARGESDEFVLPTVCGAPVFIEDGDGVFFFNFRSDRARELSESFLFENFHGFDREVFPRVHFLTMTQYRGDFPCPVCFPPIELINIFPEVVSKAGMRQLHIAETEKYAHVTFFFNGGREEPFPGEDRILVPSPQVATYDLQPEMSAIQVTDRLLEALENVPYDLVVLNFANGDMVGHTGVLEAAVKAVQTLDACLARIVPFFCERGGLVCLTADHGNCEEMQDASGAAMTAHTTNPVPFILYGDAIEGLGGLRSGGALTDIAPTLLPFLGLSTPKEMTGNDLVIR
jgi:2,3-bisphosphoglycerate-independent phosphoglycerate mutase